MLSAAVEAPNLNFGLEVACIFFVSLSREAVFSKGPPVNE